VDSRDGVLDEDNDHFWGAPPVRCTYHNHTIFMSGAESIFRLRYIGQSEQLIVNGQQPIARMFCLMHLQANVIVILCLCLLANRLGGTTFIRQCSHVEERTEIKRNC